MSIVTKNKLKAAQKLIRGYSIIMPFLIKLGLKSQIQIRKGGWNV